MLTKQELDALAVIREHDPKGADALARKLHAANEESERVKRLQLLEIRHREASFKLRAEVIKAVEAAHDGSPLTLTLGSLFRVPVPNEPGMFYEIRKSR